MPFSPFSSSSNRRKFRGTDGDDEDRTYTQEAIAYLSPSYTIYAGDLDGNARERKGGGVTASAKSSLQALLAVYWGTRGLESLLQNNNQT